jgi:hypothetical protein
MSGLKSCMVWVGGVMYGSSAFFSCALTVNLIGPLFLRQRFILPPSTEKSISGMSQKLPLWNYVSGMSQKLPSGVWVGGADVM